jgi:hypothetical protein
MQKPRLIDRLITICFCLDLVAAFWCLSIHFSYHSQMLGVVL